LVAGTEGGVTRWDIAAGTATTTLPGLPTASGAGTLAVKLMGPDTAPPPARRAASRGDVQPRRGTALVSAPEDGQHDSLFSINSGAAVSAELPGGTIAGYAGQVA
jgi:hypothetical protein